MNNSNFDCMSSLSFTSKGGLMTDMVKSNEQCPVNFAYVPGRDIHDSEAVDSAFCMQTTEVTKEHYDQWIRSKKSKLLATPSPKGFDRHWPPVVSVGWDKAKLYCEEHGWKLPTESQWERAAKGKSGEDIYATENGILGYDTANYASNSVAAVALYLPNSFGIYDLSGNVWEWTLDAYLGSSELIAHKIIKGGSWVERSLNYPTTTSRDNVWSGDLANNIGFRCITAPQKTKK